MRNSYTYRKIWKDHYGAIPKDAEGRSYEIHHIDGNHDNNAIDNLKLVTIKEHYDIHYQAGDYVACHLIAKRLAQDPSELSKFISELNKLRTGSLNPFFGKKHSKETIEKISSANSVEKGPHAESTKTKISNALKDKPKTSDHKFAIKQAHNTESYLKKMYKRIEIDGVEYDSIRLAIEQTSISRSVLYGMIKRNDERVRYL